MPLPRSSHRCEALAALPMAALEKGIGQIEFFAVNNPAEGVHDRQMAEAGDPQFHPPIMEDLKEEARRRGLWNLFLPGDEWGAGLTNLEYAPLAEIMGRVPWASEVFNCNAPDTGNMELLHLFATPEQRERWLLPLLRSVNAIAAGMRNTG